MAKRPEEEKKPEEQNSKEIPPYLAAAARIPTSYPVGAPRVDGAVAPRVTVSAAVPGIMVLNYVPTLGVSISQMSAINRASFYQFNMIRSQISGNRPYEPSDHMIYRVAVDDMRNLYAYVRRIYTIIGTYNATNLYRPRAVLDAMGLDGDNWVTHAAELYQWLHNNASALLPFPTVDIGTLSTRRLAYNTAIFTDGEVDTAQMYIINQSTFWSYEVVDSVKGLTPRRFPPTFRAFVEMWNDMYTALQQSSDAYIIAADIRRAFGDKITTTLNPPAADETVQYVKMDVLLNSIMNASIIPLTYAAPGSTTVDSLSSFRVEDRDGWLYCSPIVQVYYSNAQIGYPARYDHLNSVAADPDIATICDMVRLKVTGGWLGEIGNVDDIRFQIYSMGTEVVTGARICYLHGSTPRYLDIGGSILQILGDAVSNGRVTDAISHLSCFDWHPPVTFLNYNAEDHSFVNGWGTLEDVQNYIPLSNGSEEQIHDAMLLAEFGLE